MSEELEQASAAPLGKPDPQLIQELFDKDPLDLSSQDLDVIIAEFRSERMSYMQPAEPKAKKASSKKSSSSGPTVDVSDDLLKDLGI